MLFLLFQFVAEHLHYPDGHRFGLRHGLQVSQAASSPIIIYMCKRQGFGAGAAWSRHFGPAPA